MDEHKYDRKKLIDRIDHALAVYAGACYLQDYKRIDATKEEIYNLIKEPLAFKLPGDHDSSWMTPDGMVRKYETITTVSHEIPKEAWEIIVGRAAEDIGRRIAVAIFHHTDQQFTVSSFGHEIQNDDLNYTQFVLQCELKEVPEKKG